MTSYRRKQWSSSGSHEITAVSDKPHPDDGWNRGYAQVIYRPPVEVSAWRQTSYGGETQYMQSGSSDGSELFHNRQGRVEGAYADPTMQHTIPTLLGIAGRLHQRLTGSSQLPMPDGSLSRHSAPMVQKLLAKNAGIPRNPGNPNAEINNDIDRRRPAYASYTMDHRDAAEEGFLGPKIPDSDVAEGRQLMRSILRPPKPTEQHPAVSQQQFSQGRLFT